jgi:hypothetical protein
MSTATHQSMGDSNQLSEEGSSKQPIDNSNNGTIKENHNDSFVIDGIPSDNNIPTELPKNDEPEAVLISPTTKLEKIFIPPTTKAQVLKFFVLNWRSHAFALSVALVIGTISLLITVGPILFRGEYVGPYKYPLVYLVAYLAALANGCISFLRMRHIFENYDRKLRQMNDQLMDLRSESSTTATAAADGTLDTGVDPSIAPAA